MSVSGSIPISYSLIVKIRLVEKSLSLVLKLYCRGLLTCQV